MKNYLISQKVLNQIHIKSKILETFNSIFKNSNK